MTKKHLSWLKQEHQLKTFVALMTFISVLSLLCRVCFKCLNTLHLSLQRVLDAPVVLEATQLGLRLFWDWLRCDLERSPAADYPSKRNPAGFAEASCWDEGEQEACSAGWCAEGPWGHEEPCLVARAALGTMVLAGVVMTNLMLLVISLQQAFLAAAPLLQINLEQHCAVCHEFCSKERADNCDKLTLQTVGNNGHCFPSFHIRSPRACVFVGNSWSPEGCHPGYLSASVS